MIGNDIIDLIAAAAQTNWKRPGYIDKLFSGPEQRLILDSENQETSVWLLWAMKEAVYKAHQRRLHLPRTFNPKDFNCELNTRHSASASGTVKIGDYCYHTSTSIGNCRLHCVASGIQKKKLMRKIFSGSADVKKELISTISEIKDIPKENLAIIKDFNSVPHLMYHNRPLNWEFSLSSHGNFSAFILALRNS